MAETRIREGLTFDDVLLVPGASEVLPARRRRAHAAHARDRAQHPAPLRRDGHRHRARDRDRLAQKAASASSTRTCRSSAQAGEVDKVKRSETGMIVDPITMRPEQRIGEALERDGALRASPACRSRATARLVGILTNRDLRFETRHDQPIAQRDDEGEPRHRAARHDARAARKELLHEHRIEKLLVVDDEGKLRGLITIKDIEKTRALPERRARTRAGRLRVRRGGRRGRRTRSSARRRSSRRAST